MADAGIVAAGRRRRFWLRAAAVAVLFVWALQTGISFAFQHSRFRAVLDERLGLAFGRPVHVGQYSFSLWQGPRLEADSISVEEDPRFGYEYFLRADSLAVRLRWQALLRGRIELGTLSFDRPSLNLVRNSDGQWNIEAWLPRPARNIEDSGPVTMRRPRLRRIEVDSGRVNFKRGAEKLPFAFVDVSGLLEETGGGRWRVQLDAEPFRAATALQRAGLLHVQGFLGGTSSRLRPADLELSWHEASLSDVLRLAYGYDHGVRGDLSVVLRARTEGAPWDLQGRLELSRIHGWDLASRADNPELNFQASARWLPEESRIEMADGLMETPASNLRASGILDWNVPEHSAAKTDTRIQLRSSGVQLSDLMAWVRAFRPGLAENLAATGQLGVNVVLDGWPPRVETGRLTTEGVSFASARSTVNAHVGIATIDLAPKRLHLLPAVVSLQGISSAVHVEAIVDEGGAWKTSLSAAGQTSNIRDALDTAALFGFRLPAGWRLAGPARFDLRWQGQPLPSFSQTLGSIETTDLSVRTPFLNEPITQIRGRLESTANQRRLVITSAEGFGTRWSGVVSRDRDAAQNDWQFSLKTDRLSLAEVSAWLDPRRRESLLERVLPFFGDSTSTAPVLPGVSGKGQLEIGQLNLGSVALGRFRASAVIDGRRIELADANAEFSGGNVEGSLRAELMAKPSYMVRAKFSRVNLAALTATQPGLAGEFSGTASGEITFETSGIGRASLLRALECRGRGSIENARLAGVDLPASLEQTQIQSGDTLFSRAAGQFTCDNQQVQFSDLHLEDFSENFAASGTVDFARALDLRVRMLPAGANDPAVGDDGTVSDTAAVNAADAAYHLTGPLLSFHISRIDQANEARLPR